MATPTDYANLDIDIANIGSFVNDPASNVTPRYGGAYPNIRQVIANVYGIVNADALFVAAGSANAAIAAIAAGSANYFNSTAKALSNGVLGLSATGSGLANGQYALTGSGGGGSGFAGRAVVVGGVVISPMVVSSPGDSYTSAPTIAGVSGATITAIIGPNTVDGNFFTVPNATVGGADLYQNIAGVATYVTNIGANNLNLRQTLGYPGIIPDGISTASPADYAFADEVLEDASGFRVRGYFSAAGNITFKRWSKVNGLWVVGASTVVAIAASGYQVVTVALQCFAGDNISFNGSIIRFATAANPGEKAEVAGIYQAPTNGGAVGSPLFLYRFHIGIDLFYRSKRNETQRNVITIKSSDKLLWLRNSYASEAYELRGKGYIQKIADETEWRVEDYSVAGQANNGILANLQGDVLQNSLLPIKDIGATWCITGELANSSGSNTISPQTAYDTYRTLISTVKSLGVGVILANEHNSFFTSGGVESGGHLIRKLAVEFDTLYLSVRETANVFSPAIGGYASDYAGWTSGGHLGIRYNEILAQPWREFVAAKIGRPSQSLRIFRPRPNPDGTAPTIANKAALLFDPNNLVDRHTLFMELLHASKGISVATEKYLDEVNNVAVANDVIPSEYLSLQLGLSASFTDYAYVEAILPANGKDVNGYGIKISDTSATMFVRDGIYRDIASNAYPAIAANSPTGGWRPLQLDDDGVARMTGRNVVGSIWGDKICFLIVKAGAFTLTEPWVEWYGKPGKALVHLKPSTKPSGSELVTNPYPYNAGALAGGWTGTGTPTFGTVIQGMLPRGATGAVTLPTTADKITTALAYSADQYNEREIEISVWIAKDKALVSSAAAYPSAASITRFTNDTVKFNVEVLGGGSNVVPFIFSAGLYWTERRFRVWAPAGSTGFSVRLSPLTDALSVARMSAKFV